MLARPMSIAFLLMFVMLSGCVEPDSSTSRAPDELVIAFEIRDDDANIEANPERLASYLSEALSMDVRLYNTPSEGAMIEALRFGNADIAILDGGAAWIGWQQYGLDVLVAEQRSDGRTNYGAHAWVRADGPIASAALDDDPMTDPFEALRGTTSCHTGWLKSAGMLFPMGSLIGQGYTEVLGDPDDIDSLRTTVHGFFNENASIPDVGTPYYGYEGALRCLSEGYGDVAFAKDSTIMDVCGDVERPAWCLPLDEYLALPAFGQAPSHPVMYNPSTMDATLASTVRRRPDDHESGPARRRCARGRSWNIWAGRYECLGSPRELFRFSEEHPGDRRVLRNEIRSRTSDLNNPSFQGLNVTRAPHPHQ